MTRKKKPNWRKNQDQRDLAKYQNINAEKTKTSVRLTAEGHTKIHSRKAETAWKPKYQNEQRQTDDELDRGIITVRTIKRKLGGTVSQVIAAAKQAGIQSKNYKAHQFTQTQYDTLKPYLIARTHKNVIIRHIEPTNPNPDPQENPNA